MKHFLRISSFLVAVAALLASGCFTSHWVRRQVQREHAEDLDTLSSDLTKARSQSEYFETLFRFVEKNPRYAVDMKEGSARRVIFFGEDWTAPLAKTLIACSSSRKYFETVHELRIVATKINRDLANKFKQLNPGMRIYWVSGKEWINRKPQTPDPGGLEDDIESMNYKPL